VREVFDLTRELGAVKRYFGASEAEKHIVIDLSQQAEKWDWPQAERTKLLRDKWRDHLPREIALSQESNRVFTSLDRELEEPFLSTKKKRVFVTTSRDNKTEDEWEFDIPSRSYEVWTLLCWRKENKHLYDFVVPQKVFSQPFAKAKKSLKKDEKIPVLLRREGERFLLTIHGSEPVGVTEMRGNYEPLQ
jgi:hypothetical protein